jgi:hypothetical protein
VESPKLEGFFRLRISVCSDLLYAPRIYCNCKVSLLAVLILIRLEENKNLGVCSVMALTV